MNNFLLDKWDYCGKSEKKMKKQKEKKSFSFINKHKLKAHEVWNEDEEFYLNLNDVKKLIEIVLEE